MSVLTRREFMLANTGLGAAMAMGLSPLIAAPGGRRRPPNVLLIMADDMGYSDAGCYGGEIETPNLDRLAAGGVRFSQHYSTGRCWPSRAAILTGYYAQQVRRDSLPGIKRGPRPAWAPLLPELLRGYGYRSYHSGKWHIDGEPFEQGFEHSYVIADQDRFFSPQRHQGDSRPLPPVKRGTHYYATTAIAEHALTCLRQHAKKSPGRPFFHFLAFTSPHFPLQALKKDIEHYRELYLQGWDAVRKKRWQRMRNQGLVDCDLSALDPSGVAHWSFPEEELRSRIGPGEMGKVKPWDELTEEQKRFQATKMAIHAAMIHRMDIEIGRVLNQILVMGEYRNTVILFVSDNGASAEQIIRGDGHDPAAPPGSPRSYLCLGPGWSTAANTPFRLHKSWVHEGGIASPLIVQWLDGLKARGELRDDVGHFVDIAPTILELAGGQWPKQWKGSEVPPRPGRSLVPAFAQSGAIGPRSLWWFHSGNRAIRQGNWKLVARRPDGPWELYDLHTDRSEQKDVAGEHPEIVQELSGQWDASAEQFRRMAGEKGSGE
jgi:arylsulfatase A-like enzyme